MPSASAVTGSRPRQRASARQALSSRFRKMCIRDSSGTVTPKITTDSPLPEGTVGKSYTATLEATGNNITWSASGLPDGLPDGLTLNESTGTISGTPTTADTYTLSLIHIS